MRIRHLELSPPESITDCLPDKHRKTYQVTTIIPIFGGGVEAGVPDKGMPIRATAIRGQLRHWWRFLAANQPNSPYKDDFHALFAKERTLWGGIGDKNKGYASKVIVRVTEIKKLRTPKKYDGNQVCYALFPARAEQKTKKPAKDILQEGINFKLIITCPNEHFDEIKEAIRWWMTFGGIGSRTRRGVGSIDIEELMPISEEKAAEYSCLLVVQDKVHCKSPLDAWRKAVECLKKFRQTVPVGRNEGVTGLPGRSRWPEPDSIRKIMNTHSTNHSPTHPAMISFPRAYFGLPITFWFKDSGYGDPEETQLLPQGYERMASPLILTPYRKSNGNYAPAALLLPFKEVDKMGLRLIRRNTDVSIRPTGLSQEERDEWESKDWRNWPNNWWCSDKSGSVSPISENSKNNLYTNPLEAFMEYFSKNNKSL